MMPSASAFVAAMAAAITLSGGACPAGTSAFLCPWADNVVLIEFDPEADTVTYRDAAQSLRGSAQANWQPRQIGAASINVLTWADGGGSLLFELEDWGHGYMLRNTRTLEDRIIWRDYGWCFVGDDLP